MGDEYSIYQLPGWRPLPGAMAVRVIHRGWAVAVADLFFGIIWARKKIWSTFFPRVISVDGKDFGKSCWREVFYFHFSKWRHRQKGMHFSLSNPLCDFPSLPWELSDTVGVLVGQRLASFTGIQAAPPKERLSNHQQITIKKVRHWLLLILSFFSYYHNSKSKIFIPADACFLYRWN